MQSTKQRNLSPQGTLNLSYLNIDDLLDNPNFSFLIDKSVKREFYYADYVNEGQVAKVRKELSTNRIDENKIVPINEMTAKEIRAGADAARLQRSRDKRIICRFETVTNAKGWIRFDVSSQYTPGKHYKVHIKLKEANDLKYFKEFKKQEIIRLFLTGDLQINCTCLKGDTKIKLLDGSCPTVEEMMKRFNNGESMWVYSVDKDGNFKPGKVSNVFISGKASKLLKVTLDNGKSVETTYDHLFMKRDGSYCKAEELKVGDSLMPLYFTDTNNGYELVKFNKWPDGFHSVYKEVANEVFSKSDWEVAMKRSGEKDIAIHHIDYNKKNNSPENLRLMGVKEHIKFHADFLNDRKMNDKEFREKNIKGLRKHLKKINDNPTKAMIKQRKEWVEAGRKVCESKEWKEAQSEVMRTAVNKYWNGLSKEERYLRQKKTIEDNPEMLEKQSQIRKEYWSKFTKEEIADKNKNSIKAMSEACKHKWKTMSEEEKIMIYRKRTSSSYKKIIDKMIQNGEEVTEENFLNHFSETKRRLCKETPYGKYFNSLEEVMEFLGEPYSTYNHKIVSIESVSCDDEDVFDISVEKYHNFYVDAGIIVHNCPDFRYRMKYQAWQMGYGLFKELRYPRIANPGLEGSVCKHCLAVLRILQWNTSQITKKMINSKFFKRKYEDEEYMNELDKQMNSKKKLTNRGRRK